jgi:hypothetical protein
MQVIIAAAVAGKGAGSRLTPWSPECLSAAFLTVSTTSLISYIENNSICGSSEWFST